MSLMSLSQFTTLKQNHYEQGNICIVKAEKITARYSRKLMNCLNRLAGKNTFVIRDILNSTNKLKKYDI